MLNRGAQLHLNVSYKMQHKHQIQSHGKHKKYNFYAIKCNFS